MAAELHSLGFLHLGRPESGVRRYGQLIADEARSRPGLAVHEAEAGRVDERSDHLASVARELGDAEVGGDAVEPARLGQARALAAAAAALPARLPRSAAGHAARHLRPAGPP